MAALWMGGGHEAEGEAGAAEILVKDAADPGPSGAAEEIAQH